jgi:hypothetical protein
MSTTRFALAAFLALASCGDDPAVPDAPSDGTAENPAPPQLGAQIDRMGRPVISAALIGLADAPDVAAMKKDAYNTAADPAMWASAEVAGGRSIVAELAAKLAIIDVLDKGSNLIPGTGQNAPGCRNQLAYNGNPTGGGIAGPSSYNTLAGFLADDMLYVDTSKAMPDAYFSIELEVVTNGVVPHLQCSGRAPTYDAIDITLMALLAGRNGFTAPPGPQPRLGDGVTVHADLSDTVFPYFGPPR